jgi:hypothetical protein
MKACTSWEHGPEGWVFTVHLPLDAPEEVVNHELAHIRQRVVHGPDVEAHGPEFKEVERLRAGHGHECDCTGQNACAKHDTRTCDKCESTGAMIEHA